MSREEKVKAQRRRSYGDHILGHQNLGLMWTALLQNHYGIRLKHPVPAHLVETMMAANKLNRIAVDPAGQDHYDDGRIYLGLAQEAARKEIKDGTAGRS